MPDVLRPGWRGALLLAAVAASPSCLGGEDPVIPIVELFPGTPHTDVIGPSGRAYYGAVATPGTVYQITVTGLTDDVDLYWFDGEQTFSSPGTCLIDRTRRSGIGREVCAAVAGADSVYFGIDASDVTSASATYTIEIEEAPLSDLVLSVPVAGSIPALQARFYRLAGTNGTEYSLSLTGLTDSAAALAVLESSQSGRLAALESPKDLRFTSVGSTIYIAVDAWGLGSPATSYRILAAPAPVLGDTLVPTSGAVAAQTPVVGWVETRSISQYRAEGLPPGNHTISIVGLTGDALLKVYEDDTYALQLNCTLQHSAARECAVNGTSFYFAVESGPLNRDGAGYIILVW